MASDTAAQLLVCGIAALIAFVQAVQYPDLADFKAGLKRNANKCANIHHVHLVQVMIMLEGPVRAGYDRNSKCFICCMMEKYEMLTSDGVFLDGQISKMVSELPKSHFRDVVDKYKDECLREAMCLYFHFVKERKRHFGLGHLYRDNFSWIDRYLDSDFSTIDLDNEDICEKCYQFATCYYNHAKTVKDGQLQGSRYNGYNRNYGRQRGRATWGD